MKELEKAFYNNFKRPFKAVVSAPGRVNIIGEHTDYNEGFVLPAAIEFRTWVAFAPRDDMRVNSVALDYSGEQDSFSLDTPIEQTDSRWAGFVRGVAHVLREQGHPIMGLDLAISGNVPQGAGLSSSASMSVAVASSIMLASDLAAEPNHMAVVAQAAENTFLGCQCGIMDQMISAAGKHGKALLIDCRDLSCREIIIPPALALVIVDSGTRRELVDSEYNNRRSSCESASAKLGLASLRDLDIKRLYASANLLTDLEFKRALHVVSENERVLAMSDALANANYESVFTLLRQSHISLRDHYQVTIPAIDSLFELGNDILCSHGGMRMTGGGFGGSMVALMYAHEVDNFRSKLRERAKNIDDLALRIFVTHPGEGIQVCNN